MECAAEQSGETPALQGLARILFETMRHLDASTDKEWDDLTRSDQDYYETCIEAIMQNRGLVRQYLGADAPVGATA